MADLNIRNIDEELIRRLKVGAANEGVTLRSWCIEAFRERLAASRLPDSSSVAQSAEQAAHYRTVGGSSPSGATKADEAQLTENKCQHGFVDCPECMEERNPRPRRWNESGVPWSHPPGRAESSPGSEIQKPQKIENPVCTCPSGGMFGHLGKCPKFKVKK